MFLSHNILSVFSAEVDLLSDIDSQSITESIPAEGVEQQDVSVRDQCLVIKINYNYTYFIVNVRAWIMLLKLQLSLITDYTELVLTGFLFVCLFLLQETTYRISETCEETFSPQKRPEANEVDGNQSGMIYVRGRSSS